MNILEAIKYKVAKSARGHLDDGTFELVLLERGITDATVDFTATSEAFELATADVYKILVTSGNVSEGGVIFSLPEKKQLRQMANAIYRKHGEPEFGKVRILRGQARKSW